MAEEKKGFWGRLVAGLNKTRNNIVSGIDSIFNGFSKSYAMTGWRIGWICGNKEAIKHFSKLKSKNSKVISSLFEIRNYLN